MSSVSTHQAALTAIDRADINSASVAECVDLLGHARRLQGWLHASEARLTSKLTQHHAAGQSAPAADSLTRTGGVSAAEARRKERRSKTISDSPSFGDALAHGHIGAEHVDQLGAVTASLDKDVKAALLNSHDELLDAARSQTPEKFGRTVRNKARALEADHGIERNRQQRKQTFITHRINHETGMHEGRFALHPELGARIFSAIDRQVLKTIKAGIQRGEAEFVNRTVDHNQLAAEALGDIVTAASTNIETLESADSNEREEGADHRAADRAADHAAAGDCAADHAAADHAAAGDCGSDHGSADHGAADHGGADQGASRSSIECRAIEADIIVIVDYTTVTTGEFHEHSVCETGYGAELPPASVQRLLCNGRITPIFVDADGNPFNLGRTVRHANRQQRRALRALYRSCGFPGCDVGFWRCEMHHILSWELGGPTDLDNLIPICSRHHHVVHEGGWQLHLAPDRTLTVTEPGGNTYGTARPDLKTCSSPKRQPTVARDRRTTPPNHPPQTGPPPFIAPTGAPPGARATQVTPSGRSSDSSTRTRATPPPRPAPPAPTPNVEYEQISILAS